MFTCWAFRPYTGDFVRPLHCIDGANLYEKYKCTLLVVTVVDVDEHLCLLVYAIVESESYGS